MQLNLVEGFDLATMKPAAREALHLLAEAIKVAKADIYKYVGDPTFTQGAGGRAALEELRRRRGAS